MRSKPFTRNVSGPRRTPPGRPAAITAPRPTPQRSTKDNRRLERMASFAFPRGRRRCCGTLSVARLIGDGADAYRPVIAGKGHIIPD